MANLSEDEIIRRLGMAPDQWEFRGQCYDCGEGNFRICALTQKETRFCFTLKPKDGRKGKATIGPDSFYLLKRHAPKLYLQLERGRLWLQVMVEAADADIKKNTLRKRLGESRKRLTSLRRDARSHISAWRSVNRRGALPETLENLRLLLERKAPVFEDAETERLWCEQNIIEFERQLLQTKPADDLRVQPQMPDVPEVIAGLLPPIPEIEF